MNKPSDKFASIDEYIAAYPEKTQEVLEKIRAIAHKVFPDLEEAISYNMPTIKRGGKYAFYFGGFKHHVSIFPSTGMEFLSPEIDRYIKGRGTLQFPLDEPMPYELIEKVIRYRLTEQAEIYNK